MIWRSLGHVGIVALLREQIRLANLLARWIKEDNYFELSVQVSMGVVCFRFIAGIRDVGLGSPPTATAHQLDKLNSEIVERINASGRAYLTQTNLRGRSVMRIGLGNVLTTEDHLRKAWELICQTANQVHRED